jgi:hypothetical protein
MPVSVDNAVEDTCSASTELARNPGAAFESIPATMAETLAQSTVYPIRN